MLRRLHPRDAAGLCLQLDEESPARDQHEAVRDAPDRGQKFETLSAESPHSA